MAYLTRDECIYACTHHEPIGIKQHTCTGCDPNPPKDCSCYTSILDCQVHSTTPSAAAGSGLPVNSTPEYENALKLYGPVIETMKAVGFGLMLDGETFYQFGNELAPRERITFDMHQAYAINAAITQAERRGAHRPASWPMERLKKGGATNES